MQWVNWLQRPVEQVVYANGKDVYQVVVKVLDRNGTAVATRTPISDRNIGGNGSTSKI